MGGGAIFKAVPKTDMEGLDLLNPSPDISGAFEQHAASMPDQIETLTKQITNLRQTCELLLPKLISGDVNVSGLYIETRSERS